MKSRETSQLFHQLAAMLNAGIPIERALSSLLETLRGPMNGVVRDILARIKGGSTLAEAFQSTSGVFSAAELAVIDAGERSGRLDALLSKLGHSRDAAISMRQKMMSRLIYPVILLGVLILVSCLFQFIGPGGGFGAALRTLIASGIGVTGLCLLIRLLFLSRREGSDWQLAVDVVVARIPMVGSALSALGCARFFRTMEALYLAGINHPRAFVVASSAAGNMALAQRLAPALPLLKDGAVLSKAFAATGVFSPSSVQLLATGEVSGSLDVMLDRAAIEYEKQAETAMTALSILVPTLVYLGVALMVALKVVGFWMDYVENVSRAIDF